MTTVEIRRERAKVKRRLKKAIYNAGFDIKEVAPKIPCHYQSILRTLDVNDPFWSDRIVNGINEVLNPKEETEEN